MEEDAKVAKGEKQAPKRRRIAEKKIVVTVKIGEKVGNFKNEGLPSDLWSWRKYGQKPIKGSPYPRGYYRCSTSKGCSAKKQIERCRTDASLLIITYSSTHNHPNPNSNTQTKTRTSNSQENQQEHNPYEPNFVPALNTQDSAKNIDKDDLRHLHSSVREAMVTELLEDRCFAAETVTEAQTALLFDEEPAPSDPTLFSALESEMGNDFFDELEELPMSSSVLSKLMRDDDVSNEWIPVVPS